MPKIVVKEKKAKEGRTLVKTEKDIRRLTTETGVAILVCYCLVALMMM